MANQSKIEWTESTWNPITGCTKVSKGCKNCYAERMAKRLQAMGQPNYADGFKLTVHEHSFQKPFQWKKPQIIFVNSMSDLFHPDVTDGTIQTIFEVMRSAHWHTFQVLTKRSKRMRSLSSSIEWPANVWMGVSVENEDYLFRVTDLQSTQARIKFLSLEPLLGPIPKLSLEGIDWVIVGGESGPRARPVEQDWIIEIRDKCVASQTPFFFKQWGGKNKKKNGRLLDGRLWGEMPIQFSGA